MSIRKFKQFITEELNDPQETYIKMLLMNIREEINSIFEEESENIPSGEKTISQAKLDSKKKKKKTLKDQGITLESSEISLYSRLYDSLTIKFSDNLSSWYSVIILIDLKDAAPKDPKKDFRMEDIKKATIKIRKYDSDTDTLINWLSMTVEIEKKSSWNWTVNKDDEKKKQTLTTEDFITFIKSEIDGQDKSFQIETE
ncbi:MAG: hypothetical protein EB079_01040 [Verrucomicrobia bacterium]|nr:hypothetical protein [Verrucomicrobiota bacterium]